MGQVPRTKQKGKLMGSRFQAEKIVHDDILFDSLLEHKAYLKLRNLTANNSDITLIVKPSILIKPETEYFKKRFWKCDFELNHKNWGSILIEVKGFVTREFTFDLEMLEINNPESFSKLLIITDNDFVRERYEKLETAKKIKGMGFLDLLSQSSYWATFNDDL